MDTVVNSLLSPMEEGSRASCYVLTQQLTRLQTYCSLRPGRVITLLPLAEACNGCQRIYKQIAWPDHHKMPTMQASLEVQQETPAYVTATATFLSMIYPNQGLDRCLTREHIERMDGRDFLKVMHVRPLTSACAQGC